MNEPFVFRKVLYLVEATDKRVRTLDEMLRAVTLVDPMAISYHMHREYLAWRFLEPEWPNDFAAWSAEVLGDRILAEKLAALRVFNYRTLESLQLDLGRMIALHLEEFPAAAAQVAPPGRDLIFCMARAVVCDCHREAHNLEEFAAVLSEVESSSIYFHLFETRFTGGDRANDFALWVRQSLGKPELGQRLEEFDPYMFSVEGARRALLRIVREAR
jgi:hypothetical protein